MQDRNITEIPQGLRILQRNTLPFNVKRSIQSIQLPESLEIIDDRAFCEWNSLQSINIPNGVTQIGKYAFQNCKQLRSVTLPQTLREIGESCFCSCHSLQSIEIPEKVTIIGPNVLQDCIQLQSVILPQNLQEIHEKSFYRLPSLQSIDIPDGITRIGEKTFSYSENLQNVKLPSALQELGPSSFYSCTALQSSHIPNGVTSIEKNTFCHCKYLQSVTLPRNLKEIDDVGFRGCKSLKSIIIPDSLERIGQNAFEGCKALQMIALPRNVTVADDAFAHCDKLNETINERRDIINWLKNRFDDLPLHQLCYSISDTNTATDKLATLIINDEALIAQKDAMGMTPFHVLLSNPFATQGMIWLLASKNLSAAQVRNNFGLNPLGIYLERIEFPVANELSLDGAVYNIHEMIGMGWEIEVMAILFALKGSCIGEELNNTVDEATGLYPFMTRAILPQCRLADLYMMRKETTRSFLQEDE